MSEAFINLNGLKLDPNFDPKQLVEEFEGDEDENSVKHSDHGSEDLR